MRSVSLSKIWNNVILCACVLFIFEYSNPQQLLKLSFSKHRSKNKVYVPHKPQ